MKTKTSTEIENTPISKLILKYAIPAILSGLVGALYNIVDQIFIGNIEGVIGNAATNVAFPLVTITTALALLFGIGGTANYSISLGRGQLERAKKFAGTVVVFVPLLGVIAAIITLIFTKEILYFCGATAENFELALTYTRIVAIGYPFSMALSGVTHIIRADGSPQYSLICTVSGAVLNCILNPVFMIWLDLGIAGAGYATIISQFVSFILIVIYLTKFKTFKFTREILKPKMEYIRQTLSLGVAPAVNQISMAVAQIVMNNSLVYYGGLSSYGSDIPLAVAGIITKVNMIYMMIMVGIAQGTQPIIGYNFGAKRIDKVKECYMTSVKFGVIFSVLAFIAFQVFPQNIIALFGTGSEEYVSFATKYFQIFMFMTFLNGLQPITGNFFTAIGKAKNGAIISFTKQIFFLTPLMLILPLFMGIDGILYAGPIADSLTFIMTLAFVIMQFKAFNKMENNICKN